MKRHLSFVILGLLAAVASATPYYVGFEGDRMPEEVPGYVRHFGGGGATRSIETDPNGNSSYVCDSRSSGWIWDTGYYAGQINPTQPGEVFWAEWRMDVLDDLGYRDTGVIFARDNYGTLFFEYSNDHIVSVREGFWSYPIAPGVSHTYRIESSDMIEYRLWIDGNVVRNGSWDLNSLNHSFVTFGDQASGNVPSGALASWDYFRFGVSVPEPESLSLLLLMCVCVATLRR